jgi:hypothetical protein
MIWSFLLLIGKKKARRYSLWVTWSGGFSLRSAALRLLKVEADINGILPAGGGPLPFISFLALSRLRSALEEVTAFCVRQLLARSSPRAVKRKSFWDVVRETNRDLPFG